ncbi:hypothetical protein ACFX1Q_024298 [Malus domestica]
MSRDRTSLQQLNNARKELNPYEYLAARWATKNPPSFRVRHTSSENSVGRPDGFRHENSKSKDDSANGCLSQRRSRAEKRS